MRPRSVHRRRRDERGVMAVIVAASALLIFALAALVVDVGLKRDTDWRAQNTADATALAAANALYTVGTTPRYPEAVAAAKSYAAENYGVTEAEWTHCDDPAHLATYVASTTSCISFFVPSDPTQYS